MTLDRPASSSMHVDTRLEIMQEEPASTEAASASGTAILTPEDIKRTVERINANLAYQNVLQQAIRSLDKALTKNQEMQVRQF